MTVLWLWQSASASEDPAICWVRCVFIAILAKLREDFGTREEILYLFS